MTQTFSIIMLLLLLEAGFNAGTGRKAMGKWVVEKSSSINIAGKTNVNSFRCDVTEYLDTDTLSYASHETNKTLYFTKSSLKVDISRFDCHSKLITNDFRAALKATEHPSLKITLLSLDQFPDVCVDQSVKGVVDVSVANVVKRVEICYTVKTLPGNRLELRGNHTFSFSDFNLKAPRKMGGMIRTKDQIQVNFKLCFKEI